MNTRAIICVAGIAATLAFACTAGAATPTPTPVILGEDNFDGAIGETVPGWAVVNADIKYAEGSLARCTRTAVGDCLVRSPELQYDPNISRVQVKLDYLAASDYYLLRLQMNEPPYSHVDLTANSVSQPGLWDLDANASILSSSQTIESWSGKQFFLEVWFQSEIRMDFVRLCNYRWRLSTEEDTVMAYATPVAMAHFMTFFGYDEEEGSPRAWWGWNAENHNPNATVTPVVQVTPSTGKRDIAATYYPIGYFPTGYHPNPIPCRYGLDGPYTQEDDDLVNRHVQCLQVIGADGGIFDVESYWEIVEGVINTDTLSHYQTTARRYLKKFQALNTAMGRNHYRAIPVYEDKTQWLRGTAHANRAATVTAAKNDLNAWMELFFTTYSGVGYTINGRPVVYIFSYEDLYGSRGYGRLSGGELKAWSDAWAAAHGDVEPIIVTNIQNTAHSAELEADGAYSAVLDGYFEWPEHFTGAGAPPAGYTTYHTLAEEKTHWAMRTANIRLAVANGQYKYYGIGAWPGFNDAAVNGWGTGTRGIQYGADGEYTLNYHLDRAIDSGFPVIHLATWNDWFEGTNIEPAVEFYALFPAPDGGIWPMQQIRSAIAGRKGITANTANLWLPYMIYTIKKLYPLNLVALHAATLATIGIDQAGFIYSFNKIFPHIQGIFKRPAKDDLIGN